MNLCSNPDDKLQIYRDNFEKAYMDSTERFYRTQAPAYLQQNGVQNYMKYVSEKNEAKPYSGDTEQLPFLISLARFKTLYLS